MASRILQNNLLLLRPPAGRALPVSQSVLRACRWQQSFKSEKKNMGLFYSSRSASSSLKAQTNFGGEGFHPDGVDEYKALEGIEVYQTSSQEKVVVTDLWKDDERCILVFARSMGWPFCQELARQINNDVLSKLQEKSVKLFLISIGPPERGRKFNDLTGLPEELILADPDNLTYDSLEFRNDTFSAFFSPETPKALWRRIREGDTGDLGKILKRWPSEGFFIPPKNKQAKQQGGTLVFDGQKTLWRYNDPATSAHAKPDQILKEGLKGL